MERRQGERFKSGGTQWARLILAENITIKDISISGLSLETSMRLSTNSIYRIEIASRDQKKITPAAEVVRSFLKGILKGKSKEKGDSIPLYEVGLKFIKLHDTEKQFIEDMISNLSIKK